MKGIKEKKSEIRLRIAQEKKLWTPAELEQKSNEVLSVVEISGVFQNAKTIFIYNNLPDEVQTVDFINKWSSSKQFYIPAVESDELIFRKYGQDTQKRSSLGIMEPEGEDFTNYAKVDLIIIPGIAFDRNKNRLGRGKGHYDRFLKKISAPKMGICFDFQLLESIPTEHFDIKMDFVVSENDFIW